jgi:ketosteroid isomerase-like protein
MSQENVELFHEAVDAFNRRDLDAFLALIDPEAELTPYVVALEGRYTGHSGVRRWWQNLFEVFPDWRIIPAEVRDLGDVTLALLRVRGHGGQSGTPIDVTIWQLGQWSVDGKLVRMSNHGDEAEALEAVGLRE